MNPRSTPTRRSSTFATRTTWARSRRQRRRGPRRQPCLRRHDGHLHRSRERPHQGHQVPDLRLRLGRGHLEHDHRPGAGHDSRRRPQGQPRRRGAPSTGCRPSRCTAATWRPTPCTRLSRTGAQTSSPRMRSRRPAAAPAIRSRRKWPRSRSQDSRSTRARASTAM